MNEHLYAGWVVVDLRLFLFTLLVSLFLTVSMLALFARGRKWHEYITMFVAIYSLAVTTIILIFNEVAGYPIFRIEAFFPFP